MYVYPAVDTVVQLQCSMSMWKLIDVPHNMVAFLYFSVCPASTRINDPGRPFIYVNSTHAWHFAGL